MSAGKSADIGEMLTRRKALSDVPGELQLNDVLLTESCFQRCGTVHEISCCAHDADCPPATAANCSAVGSGGSASSSSASEEEEDEEPASFAFGAPEELLATSGDEPLRK